MRPGDRFRIGSVTKTFVAAVVLQLVGEQKLALDDTVERWLPGIVPNGGTISVRQLLNHTSGLFNYTEDHRVFDPYLRGDLGHTWTARELVEIATSHPPLFAPGARWSYSNTNYALVGLIVEAATGRSPDRAVRRCAPLPQRRRLCSLRRLRSDPLRLGRERRAPFPGDGRVCFFWR